MLILGSFKLVELQTLHATKAGTPEDVRDNLENLKLDIDSYYKTAIDRIMEKEEWEKAIIIRLLTWVLHCKDRISPLQLRVALRNQNKIIDIEKPARSILGDVAPYISACEGLLTTREEPLNRAAVGWRVVPDITIVVLAHETVNSYLRDHPALLLPNPNYMILEACVNINLQTKLTLLEPASSVDGVMEDWDWERKNGEGAIESEADYAVALFAAWSRDWGDYVEAAIAESAELANSKADEFLSAIDAACGPNETDSGDEIDSLTRDWNNWKPLHYCAANGWSALCQRLLAQGTDPNIEVCIV